MARAPLAAIAFAAVVAHALVACSPEQSSAYVVAVDDMGMPITSLSVPVSAVGQVRELAIHIANESELEAGALVLALSGDAAADFTVTSCQGTVLHPEESCTASLTFRSNVAGKRKATLSITADTTTTVELRTDVFMPQ